MTDSIRTSSAEWPTITALCRISEAVALSNGVLMELLRRGPAHKLQTRQRLFGAF